MVNNIISVPMYEKDASNHIKPNLLFHRTSDRVHSRCIEYPFAASCIGDANLILDVGSAKANKTWMSWLDSLDIEVHCTDYDTFDSEYEKVKCFQSDIRCMDIKDNTYDKVIAVSVLEHVGLANPQVYSTIKPEVNDDGDLQAFKELVRILKPGGEIIMTVPFGVQDGLILGNQARNYTATTIHKFSSLADPLVMDYYEYQHSLYGKLYTDNLCLLSKISSIFNYDNIIGKDNQVENLSGIIGPVVWRFVSMNLARARQLKHVDGVLCSVWRKSLMSNS